jgi:hypothetical protein
MLELNILGKEQNGKVVPVLVITYGGVKLQIHSTPHKIQMNGHLHVPATLPFVRMLITASM